MTNIAPTSTEGEATPISTPTAHDTAIIDKLVTKDCPALLKTEVDKDPVVM